MMIINVLFFLSLLAVLGSLIIGLFGFVKGKTLKDHEKSNTIMRMRVWLQALALLLFFIAFWLRH